MKLFLTISWLKETGVETIDFAKAMIDEGFHPMTTYFPLVVSGAMLIEPTESEAKHELDQLCDALLSIAKRAQEPGASDAFKSAPILRRVGELTKHARRANRCSSGLAMRLNAAII